MKAAQRLPRPGPRSDLGAAPLSAPPCGPASFLSCFRAGAPPLALHPHPGLLVEFQGSHGFR